MLSQALYDADDLLDEFSYEALSQQVMGGSKIARKVRLFFSSSNPFAFGLRIGHKVKALRERLDEIAAEKNKFHLEERFGSGRYFLPKGMHQTHSSPPQVVIGREHDKEEIIRILLSSNCDENVSVVSIVGIGGLGKTTLAQMVYNDDRVKNHFELNMWVCVSDVFDVQLLVKNVLESVSRQESTDTQMDLLKNRLHENINGRRYFLVLDDVWNEDVNKWSSLMDLLANGARGSKIVVTTRLRTVAEMSRSISIYELRGLSENESWSLFKQVAFKQGQLPNPNLEAMGKEIVEKCCGVPLAIKTIGGVLYFKDSDSQWVLFKDNELSKIDVFKNDVLPILRLSYNNLPSHYKHCFAYCSLYPKDFRIPVEELIQLWKAQGYVKSTDVNECLQDVGFDYFMDLFRLSFFQDMEMDDSGNIEYCKMHDLMHDLAVSIAGENFSTSHSRMTHIKNNTQHVSFHGSSSSLSRHMSSLLKARNIRTILALDVGFDTKKEINEVFSNMRCLRVLKLSHMGINKLPNSICKLKHLRHLDLSHNLGLRKLPNSITNLHNLLVLKLEWCSNLVQLPNNISKLVNLTTLDNNICNGLTRMPRGIGNLLQLEKLPEFVIAKDRSISKHVGGLDELHSLNNLRGELKIKNLRYVKNVASEFKKAKLCLKEKLHTLTFYCGNNRDDGNHTIDIASEEMGMEALCPHPNLKQLMVWFYRGVKPPSWLPSLTSLVSVVFRDCMGMQWLTPLDQLPCLKKLFVYGLTNMEFIDVENEGGYSLFYPSLTDLYLVECPKLKGFKRKSSLSTEELPCFPRLTVFHIRGCRNLTYLPFFPEVKILFLDGDGVKSVKMPKKSASKSSSSPFPTLSQLMRLEITNMEDPFENELLHYVPNLQHLTFIGCSFRNVCCDEKDDGIQWKNLKILRSIQFYGMENLVDLPKGLQYLTTLRRFYVYDCPGLACLPEWMPKLDGLKDLSISGSQQLQERCKNNTASDWPKISHIPNIAINDQQIQRNGYYLL